MAAYGVRISDWSSDVCSSGLAHDDPVDLAAELRPQRSRHAGQEARRAQVGVLVEALADRQPQLPEGDVIGNLGIADGAGVDGIEAAQRGDALPGHRSEKRQVGQECVSTGRSWWPPYP